MGCASGDAMDSESFGDLATTAETSSTDASSSSAGTTSQSMSGPATSEPDTSGGATTGASDSECGDEVIDPVEECDGEVACGEDCRVTTEIDAFRVTEIEVFDPPLHTPGACTGITTAANNLINMALNGDMTTDPRAPGFGLLDLSPVLVFYPLRATHPGGHFGVTAGRCTAAETVCSPGASGVTAAQYANLTSGTCFAAAAEELAPGSVVPSVQSPCMVAQSTSANLDFSPFPLQLQSLSVSGQFSGDPTDQIINGVLRGFLLESSACDPANTIAPDYPVVGDRTIGELLAAGTLDCGGCGDRDDRDSGPNGESGWWFYAGFTATRVPFEGA